ncbi:MAG: transporter substrate-binding domain-containing protein [Hyphomicrobiales bacterium]|nr:transporter substrate-binding domain-containing protein [Hyphomicrobiales bacterium]MBV8826779.1 transporter substrate-binding domain-containing protein [Hyphomicrobiales bacterium]
MQRIVFAAALALAAAGAALGQEPPLKTGVDATFAPHAMPKLSGGIEGFNVDLANEIAKRLHRGIEIDATQFSGLLPGLQAGSYDFIAAPTTVTKERAENMLFTEGYLNTDFQFVVKKDTPDIKALEELKGKTIAVNKGAVYDSWARDLAEKIGWTVESYGTNTDAIQAVISGRAYANVAGNTASAWAVKNNLAIKLSYLYSTGLVWAAPVRKDNVALRNKLELAIECMKKDGTLGKMHERWFSTAPAPDSAAAVIFPGSGVPGMPGYDPTPHELTCS